MELSPPTLGLPDPGVIRKTSVKRCLSPVSEAGAGSDAGELSRPPVKRKTTDPGLLLGTDQSELNTASLVTKMVMFIMMIMME